MRIISGSRRGKKLLAPKGDRVRPTEDRVKEALFGIIQFQVPGASFLDLFAGTGQMGIESISRGAARAAFVENAPESLAVLGKNLEATGFAPQAQVVRADVLDYWHTASQRFDLVFADPPYREGLLPQVLALLPRVLLPDGEAFCEHPRGEELPDRVGPLLKIKTYGYGKTGLTRYRLEAPEGS